MKLNRCIVIICCLVNITNTKPPQMLANRQPSKPFISGDGFRAMANHVFDETDYALRGSEVQNGDIVFVKSDKMGDFFSKVHPTINAPYILITHNSDAACPGEFAHYLKDPKIIRWFGQNPSISGHPQFVAIPIGIANSYVSPHGNRDNFMKLYGANPQKEWNVGINFVQSTYLHERSFVFNKFINQPYCKELYSQDHYTYLSKMSRAYFILSPRGNGLDCHRTWEAYCW